MSTTPKRNVSRSITRIKEVWRELDNAQRRSLELRTGLAFDRPARDARSRAEIQELESLYDLPAAREGVRARTAVPRPTLARGISSTD